MCRFWKNLGVDPGQGHRDSQMEYVSRRPDEVENPGKGNLPSSTLKEQTLTAGLESLP